MKTTNYLILVIAVLVAGGLGFFGGTVYQRNVTPRNLFGMMANVGRNRVAGMMGGTAGGNFQRFGVQGFRPVVGQVISKDNNSLTVKANDGTSRIVLISGTTAFNKAVQAAIGDVSVGDTVRVIGNVNSDGSVTAQDVQLNPIVQTPSATPNQ